MNRVLFTCTTLALAPGAWALGIRLFDHDAFATARGNAFVATADNPSAVYYNPAGITQLKGHNVRAGVYNVGVESTFNPDAPGPNLETKDDFIPLPGMFYTCTPEKLPFSFGAGYFLPFGLSREWPDRAPFRNVTTKGELEYDTFAGIVAWRINDTLSVGGGPTFNYARAELRRGQSPNTRRDEFRFEGDAMEWGAVAGVLWQPARRHSFGISYRGPTTMELSGTSSSRPAASPRQRAEAELPLPQVIVAGYSFRPTTNWNIEVDVDWTDWDCVNALVLEQSTGRAPLALNWDSSWTVELGATRYWSSNLHTSAGYMWIQNSSPSRSFDPLVPDQDLHVFSAGIGGELARVTWDFTYQFTWGIGRDVSGSVHGPGVSGHYDFVAHGVSVSLGYRF
jgi:long-chain fatty acid transport protein